MQWMSAAQQPWHMKPFEAPFLSTDDPGFCGENINF